MKLNEQELEKLRQISIFSILGKNNNGRRFSICCPIHTEKTPSMVLYPDGGFHCYGCSANGKNAIDFMVALGCTFNEAIEELKKLST